MTETPSGRTVMLRGDGGTIESAISRASPNVDAVRKCMALSILWSQSRVTTMTVRVIMIRARIWYCHWSGVVLSRGMSLRLS